MSDFVTRSTRQHRHKHVSGFSVLETQRGREVVVTGELNVNTLPELRDALTRAIDCGDGELFVRLRDAEVADAAALAVLIAGHQRALQAGRLLVLGEVSTRLDRVIRSTKLSRVLTWTTTTPVAAAI